MITRIEITSTIPDPRAEVLTDRLIHSGYKISVAGVTDVYTIDKQLDKTMLRIVASILTDANVQRFDMLRPAAPGKFDWAVEIGNLPGVTDNVATTAREIISDRLHVTFTGSENMYTSIVYFIRGRLSELSVRRMASELYNPLIQRSEVKSRNIFIRDKGMGHFVPKVTLYGSADVSTVNLNMPDTTLASISASGIQNTDGTRRGPLALSTRAMKTIAHYFMHKHRSPTDIELESIAQTWSEHCKHIIFNSPLDDFKEGLFRHYIKRATDEIRAKKGKKDFCVSVFADNSGAIRLNKTFLLTHKVETHNSPSALDPFGGSVTGIVGVNRDTIGFGLGAKPIINVYGFCLADPDSKIKLYKGAKKTLPMLTSRRILDGVAGGVNSGGNCSGIPTPLGFLYFDERFRGKPLVFVGTLGLIPVRLHNRKSYMKKAKPADYIVMVGGRVGLDGIHGATFSSEALSAGSPATAVQIGDPITQKKLSDAIVKEARDLNLYSSITDNGAGGLSCSVAEMAKESGGCVVQLDRVPLKYQGLAPWQIWISESQERMTVSVPKKKWQRFYTLMKSRGVEATVIGTFTNSHKCIVRYKGKTVMDIDMDFLHNGFPYDHLQTKPVVRTYAEPSYTNKSNYTPDILKVMASRNIAGCPFLARQYDHEVQGTSVTKPLQGRGQVNADATVSRPILSDQIGVALSFGLAPSYGDIDMYASAAASLDTAVRACIVAGADPDRIALLDNFCWSQSRNPERLYELKQAARACFDLALVYGTPFISGKDSMYNEFAGFDAFSKPVTVAIPPTVLISGLGILDDCADTVTLDAKMPKDLVYILGNTFNELGGSQWYALSGAIGNTVPNVRARENIYLYRRYYMLVKHHLLVSGQSVGKGGLAAALVKTSLGGRLGMYLTLPTLPGNVKGSAETLFSESQGRIVVTVAPHNKKRFEKLLVDIPHSYLGTVSEDGKFIIKNAYGSPIIDTTIDRLCASYQTAFAGY